MVAAVAETRVAFYPTQHDFVLDERKWVAFVAGRNSGKTYAGSWKAVERARRGGLGIIAAPDFPMLEFGAKRAFLERLRQIGAPFELHQQRGVVTIAEWDAEVRFATLETESRVRGPEYAWGWVDEVEYVTDRGIWQALKGAIRHPSLPVQLFVTTTPKGRRLVWDEWVQHATPDHGLYRASTRENRYIAADEYIAALGYSGRFLQQEIEAEFVGYEGLVYPGWDRLERLREVDCAGWRTVLGVDVGTRNPTAILTVRVAGYGRVHVERMVYRRNMSASEVVGAIQAEADRCKPEAIYVDPSAAGYVLDLRRGKYPVRKAENDRVRGVQIVTTAVADGLTADPACMALADEFEAYHYPEGNDRDDPVKDHDHALDALRYALVGVFGRLGKRPASMSWV
jgi:hypothetical protein